jgi:anthranilate synthase component 2
MRIALIDNYDSFTYNLVHYLQKSGNAQVSVIYNDFISPRDLADFDRIVISPGPGLPDAAGITCETIKMHGENKPILGVCLGQQAIGEVYGARLKQLKKVLHGLATQVRIIDPKHPLLAQLPETISVGHYHSWVVDADTLPVHLIASAVSADGEIMALRHARHPVCGVQFHPESLLTPLGQKMIDQWLETTF